MGFRCSVQRTVFAKLFITVVQHFFAMDKGPISHKIVKLTQDFADFLEKNAN